MKRSEMVNIMWEYIKEINNDWSYMEKKDTNLLLTLMQSHGMSPPKVKAADIRDKSHRWGGGCSMRCVCDECDPNYLMHEWEKE
jgi:hypothetical protein